MLAKFVISLLLAVAMGCLVYLGLSYWLAILIGDALGQLFLELTTYAND
jgi:hypothetical protein